MLVGVLTPAMLGAAGIEVNLAALIAAFAVRTLIGES